MKHLYEIIEYDNNLPAKVRLLSAPAWEHRTQSHWHREIELIYMVDGHLDVTKGGESYSLDSGGVMLINSGEIHQIDSEDGNAPVSCLMLHLSMDFAKHFYESIDTAYFAIEKNTHTEEKICELMSALVLCDEQSDDFISLTRYSLITQLLHVLFTECRRKRRISMYGNCKVSFRNAKIAIEYIAEHYRENITLNSIAELVGLNPVYFSKYFKDVTDTSFITYLNRVRLEHAIDDMVNSDMSVGDACENNGFANIKSFTEVCKRSYGLTPLQLKKSRIQQIAG